MAKKGYAKSWDDVVKELATDGNFRTFAAGEVANRRVLGKNVPEGDKSERTRSDGDQVWFSWFKGEPPEWYKSAQQRPLGERAQKLLLSIGGQDLVDQVNRERKQAAR